MYAGVLGEFDTAESEIKAERVARVRRSSARRKGGPMGRVPTDGGACTSVMLRGGCWVGRMRSTSLQRRLYEALSETYWLV